jgi:hypothetical protein
LQSNTFKNFLVVCLIDNCCKTQKGDGGASLRHLLFGFRFQN